MQYLDETGFLHTRFINVRTLKTSILNVFL